MSLFTGIDFSTFLAQPGANFQTPGMDLGFTPISGPQACIEILLRKLQCPPGSMDDIDWGLDLRSYLGASMTSSGVAALQAKIRAAINAEEYVEDSDVTVLLSVSDGSLVVDCAVQLADLNTYTFAFQLSPANFSAVISVGQNFGLPS